MDHLSDYLTAIKSKRTWSDPAKKKEFDEIVQSMQAEISVALPLFNDQSPESLGEGKDDILHTRRKDAERALELWRTYSKPA